jgi:hypothetical protein
MAGTITEPAGGLITAATLTGSSAGGTTLNQINQLANLGTFTNTGAGGFAPTGRAERDRRGERRHRGAGLTTPWQSGGGRRSRRPVDGDLNSAERSPSRRTTPQRHRQLGGRDDTQSDQSAGQSGYVLNTGAGGFALTDGRR